MNSYEILIFCAPWVALFIFLFWLARKREVKDAKIREIWEKAANADDKTIVYVFSQKDVNRDRDFPRRQWYIQIPEIRRIEYQTYATLCDPEYCGLREYLRLDCRWVESLYGLQHYGWPTPFEFSKFPFGDENPRCLLYSGGEETKYATYEAEVSLSLITEIIDLIQQAHEWWQRNVVPINERERNQIQQMSQSEYRSYEFSRMIRAPRTPIQSPFESELYEKMRLLRNLAIKPSH